MSNQLHPNVLFLFRSCRCRRDVFRDRRDIICAQLFHDFFGAFNHGIRNTGKFCNLDTVALIRTALHDLAQKYNVVAFSLTAIQ